ncbi:CapA family protein [Paenibacillus soyae]|uniref:CapA family protein n=1 Tax=Paenibacillus soyae TaxID=2969249 RepID=A0A9X2MRP1_9BACL|nr:CapA family protein [Paenibacillus soyae]
MSNEWTIAAVGDLLVKPQLIKAMRTVRKPNEASGHPKVEYDFGQAFEAVAPYLKQAHLTIGNLETNFAGGASDYTQTHRHASNRNPLFNCPDELAPALKEAGFDVLATANNHCMDYGIRGLKRTLATLDKFGITHVGTFRDQNEARSLCLKTVQGMRVGILAYTRGTNGIPVPKGQPAGVKKLNRNAISKDMERLRAVSDLIIVCMHNGYEYDSRPSDPQKSWVRFLFNEGADLVLGSHPHVLQPAICLKVKDKFGRTRKRFAIYSLGNFISTRLHGKDEALTGIIALIKIKKNKRGSFLLSAINYVPTWVWLSNDKQEPKCRIIPIHKSIAQPEDFDSRQLNRIQRAFRRTLRMYEGVMSPLD